MTQNHCMGIPHFITPVCHTHQPLTGLRKPFLDTVGKPIFPDVPDK